MNAEQSSSFAYELGRKDYLKGIKLSNNPFTVGTNQHYSWSEGWQDQKEIEND